jgi:hypothetical protein
VATPVGSSYSSSFSSKASQLDDTGIRLDSKSLEE